MSIGDTMATMPGLHLPQKQHPRQSTQHTPSTREALQEIPTRPESPARETRSQEAEHLYSMSQPIAVGVGWHSGIVRRHSPNEDSLVVLQGTCTYLGRLVPFSLLIVADGMGGHDYGLEASRLAMQSMMHTVLSTIVMGNELTGQFLIDMMIGGAQWANAAVLQRGQEWGKEIGTTLTAALVVGYRAYIVNVGDSRTYIYRADMQPRLKPITRDHSRVARLVEAGRIAPEDVYTHPERNKVYRSLGSEREVEIDWFVIELESKDELLLCSDGLWEMVRDPEIERVLNYGVDPTRSCDMLVQAALRGGGRDNISVIVAQVP